MTQPVEDVEKLARELAEAAISPQLFAARDAGIGTILLQMRTYDRIIPILRTHFAARDAEIEELNRLILSHQHTIAAQSAEIERLRDEMKPLVDELDQVKDLREQDAYAHSQECGQYEVELATLRERLEATE